jgi:alpha-beta hydrolase superfamily lysophospholipase
LAADAVAAGWTAVGIDLPGHGLSTGPRADIDSFFDYAAAFESVISIRQWPRPWRVAAHSTGCATVLMTMRRTGLVFDDVILEAPLVRTFLWTPSITAKHILGGAISTLPRRDGGLPPTQAFYRLLRSDPLYISTVPLHWFDALERYYVDTLEWNPLPGKFLILQGTKDSVVDASYNIPYLKKLLPGAQIVEVDGGKHHLLRDEGPAGVRARLSVAERWTGGQRIAATVRARP